MWKYLFLRPCIPVFSLSLLCTVPISHPCPFVSSLDSYSAAGSEGSISTSVVSLPPQASGSSAPSSPGSRRSVSTLKKWLTNPVRKLSVGASSKGERQVRKIEGKPPSSSHSQDLGNSPRPDEPLTILPVTHRELVRSNDLNDISSYFNELFNKWLEKVCFFSNVVTLLKVIYLKL